MIGVNFERWGKDASHYERRTPKVDHLETPDKAVEPLSDRMAARLTVFILSAGAFVLAVVLLLFLSS